MHKFLYLAMAALLALPMPTFAASSEDAMISELQKQIEALSGELEELSDRLDDTERHSTLDRIELSGDLRARAHSLHYEDVTFNPGINVNMTDFFMKIGMGELGGFNAFNPAYGDPTVTPPTLIDGSLNPTALDSMFYGLAATNPELYNGLLQAIGGFDPNNPATHPGVMVFPMGQKNTYNINNDILYTSRLRLNMNAKVWDNVKFSGRLLMFKNWGDSTGSQVFDSWNRFTMDATNGGNTTGDTLRVDRAYFDWSNIADSGFYVSIGRRPSTGGPPLHFRENEMRGGTPTGNVMSLNFDGITIGRNLEDWTGIEGMVARFCYGQGFESEWGNGEMFNEIVTKDTHFAGFNVDILNDGTNFLQVTAFRAMDLNDGFKGVIAFPTQYGAMFAPTLYNDLQKFPNFNFVTRVQPSTTIGDIDLGGVVFAREELNGINWFVSGGMTITRPNNNAGMFGGMGSDAIFEAELNSTGTEVIMVPKVATEADDEEGYGFYAGVQIPAPLGKLGLEYNYGSEHWTPFTQAQDDALGSKIATRGHVGEAYYIFDINPRMFIKLAGLYYDFEYTGSGSPVGKPQKVDDIKDGKAYSLMPVIDTAYDLNASLTVQF
ncbi:MAG: DUF3373 domain-containing protein [Desulfuromonadales bacterium]|nr:DUF3373 domain-containing protein [Desulfuromonadales bacterium]